MHVADFVSLLLSITGSSITALYFAGPRKVAQTALVEWIETIHLT